VDRFAYSLLEIKSLDAERRVITGIASTPSPDLSGDVMEPKGAEFSLPIPLLWQHDRSRPIGEVVKASVQDDGIHVEARIAKVDEPGLLKDLLDLSWQSIRTGLVKGLSVGFRPLDYTRIPSGGYHIKRWRWAELSAVTLAENTDASILSVKSADTAIRAALRPTPVTVPPSGVSDTSTRSARSGGPMKSTAEKIKGFEQEKSAKYLELKALMEVDDLSTISPEDQAKGEEIKAQIASCDNSIKLCREYEEISKSMAVPVVAETPAQAATSRAGLLPVVSIRQNLEPGQEFARYAMCVAACKGNLQSAYEMSKVRYPDNPGIHTVLKAAVAAGTTLDSTWAGSLVQYRDIATPFLDYLRPNTIVDRIPGLTRVPFKVRYGVQSAGTSGSWVGEAKPKPVTKAGFTTGTLDFHKVACISVLTEEEVRFSSPSAELKVRNDLARAVIARMDQDFIDPANAGTANVKPASITNGIVAVTPTGTTADDLMSDLATVLSSFATNNLPLTGAVVIMSASMAIQIALMRNTLGVRSYPDMTVNGGSILGMTVIVSQYLQSLGSPGTGMIVVLQPEFIFLADDGNVTVDASREASVEMLDSALVQDATVGTGASLVSLWQNNLVGLRAEREITWKRGRDTAVAYISNAAYVA
jgi:HK97 family phage major capsid protein/HK97 family phage prohead protease